MVYELENRIVHALAELPLDYREQMAFIREERKRGVKWESASVLALLGKYPTHSNSEEKYFFLLNKRSANVRQPGDLCFPGGHPNQWKDLISSRLIVPYVLPLRKGKSFQLNKKINRESFQTIMYFLGNSIRESFEEIRLNPFKIDFLGALRCYRLEPFHKLIFPMVGIMKEEIKFKPNWEVDKIIKLPLTSLFNHSDYAIYNLKLGGSFRETLNANWADYDCFIHREDGQPDEILWGATYNIIMSFLNTIFDFTPPDTNVRPIIRGELYPSISHKM